VGRVVRVTGGYPARMTRFRTRWAVIAFLAVGVLLALWLIVRDLGGGDDPEQNGTLASSAPR
jgi:hypothetical protein